MMFMNLIWAWGPSGGLYPDPAFVRHLLGSGVHILEEATVRLPIHGAGHHGDLRARLHRVAASLLYNGSGWRRERHFRHRVHDHRGADRGEDLQLAVHDVRWPRRLHDAHAVRDRLHGDVRDRRHDGCASRRPSGGFRPAQQPVPGGAFSQCHNWRRTLWRLCRIQLLVPEGLSASGCTKGWDVPRFGAGSSASTLLSCRSTCSAWTE